MKQATVTVLLIMLATASAIPSLWSDYYRNALYRNNAAKLQQASRQCSVGDVPATISCQSARLTTGGKNAFVHVCPVKDIPQEVCYNSKLPRCCQFDVQGDRLKCVSATKLTVGGHQVTVGIYEVGEEHCAYFQTNAVVQRCCPGGVEIPCTTNAVQNVQMQAESELNVENKAFSEDWQKQLLEERILAEVEKIMDVGEQNQQVEEESVALTAV